MSHHIAIDARKLTDFGIGTYIDKLLAALAEIDQENRYLLLAGPQHREQLEALPDNFRVVPERAAVYSMRELATVSWHLLKHRVDLYHATHYVLPAVLPCRVVVTIHDIIHLLYPEFLPGPLAFFYAQRMIRRSLVKGDRIIANSQNTKSDLMEYFEVDGRKIQVIYHGVSSRFRKQLPAETIAKTRGHLGLERPYVLFVGNPKPHKNLDRVVQAFGRAHEIADIDADLVCVGDRGNRDFKIRLRAEQLGISERVKLLGYVDDDDLTALYQGAKLFLYPTLYEGFGLPVVEAMASGVAVVTSRSSALREIAEGYADLVDPQSVDDIAAAVARCLTDDRHRDALVELGRKRAEEFRWRRTARQTLDLYLRVLEAGDDTRSTR